MDQVIEKLQNADTIMEVTDLCKFFKAGKKQVLKAVDHVTVSIKRGETLGLVGESGCGKTTCGRTMMKLYEPTSGKVVFDGKDISTLKGQGSAGVPQERPDHLPGPIRFPGPPA